MERHQFAYRYVKYFVDANTTRQRSICHVLKVRGHASHLIINTKLLLFGCLEPHRQQMHLFTVFDNKNCISCVFVADIIPF